MPLEALYSLMKIHHEEKEHVLKGWIYGADYSVLVTQEYFQSIKGFEKTKPSDDVLAFCSLVLSYAKSAKKALQRNESPKLRTTIMPRNDFVTIFNQVKSKLPGDLFPLFQTLACYKTTKGKAE